MKVHQFRGLQIYDSIMICPFVGHQGPEYSDSKVFVEESSERTYLFASSPLLQSFGVSDGCEHFCTDLQGEVYHISRYICSMCKASPA